jgi:hypothetical protein
MNRHQTQEQHAIKKRSDADFKTAGLAVPDVILFHLGQIAVAR